jgi:hypothetical protein
MRSRGVGGVEIQTAPRDFNFSPEKRCELNAPATWPSERRFRHPLIRRLDGPKASLNMWQKEKSQDLSESNYIDMFAVIRKAILRPPEYFPWIRLPRAVTFPVFYTSLCYPPSILPTLSTRMLTVTKTTWKPSIISFCLYERARGEYCSRQREGRLTRGHPHHPWHFFPRNNYVSHITGER